MAERIKSDRGLTRYRKVVLEVLKEHPHSDAYEIHRFAAEIEPSISLPTVYRALKYLKEKGIITERRFKENHSHYEVVESGKEKLSTAHIHLVCEKCGAVSDISSYDVGFTEKLLEGTGFKATDIHIDVFGICENCQKK